MTMTLLIGGARSGKTTAAEKVATASARPVVYIATGEPGDEEMAARIARHQQSRPPGWTTVESPRDLAAAVAETDESDCVVLDCLTLWVSNCLDEDDERILEAARDVATALAARSGPSVVVTNEVGSGIVPADAEVRRYRDLLGRVNAAFRAEAAVAYLCLAGGIIPIEELAL
jgi:adenosyl cobinamide kinase/adenosyl cobinamide phosphate guanylyltransferase